jgi:glutathione S-transferase
MKLYYFPNACSISIHLLLEEVGATFDLVNINLAQGAQHQPDFLSVNPKAKVPALELDDGTIITELPAIAYYLARKYPDAKLFPDDLDSQTKALALMEYMTATVHMRGFTRIFRPAMFSPTPSDEAAVKEAGIAVINKGLELLAAALGDKDYLLGAYSVADATLFFLEWWAVTRAGLAVPPAIQAHLERMKSRPAVQRALAKEGLA